jgi:hypothetical protein
MIRCTICMQASPKLSKTQRGGRFIPPAPNTEHRRCWPLGWGPLESLHLMRGQMRICRRKPSGGLYLLDCLEELGRGEVQYRHFDLRHGGDLSWWQHIGIFITRALESSWFEASLVVYCLFPMLHIKLRRLRAGFLPNALKV